MQRASDMLMLRAALLLLSLCYLRPGVGQVCLHAAEGAGSTSLAAHPPVSFTLMTLMEELCRLSGQRL